MVVALTGLWFRIQGTDKDNGEARDFRVPAKDAAEAEARLWALDFATSNVRPFLLTRDDQYRTAIRDPGFPPHGRLSDQSQGTDDISILDLAEVFWLESSPYHRDGLYYRVMESALRRNDARVLIDVGWQWIAEWPVIRKDLLKFEKFYSPPRQPRLLAEGLRWTGRKPRADFVDKLADRFDADAERSGR